MRAYKVLQMATEVDTGFTAEFLPLLWWLAGMLYQGMASNEFHNNNYPESIKNYGLAAAKLLRSEMPELADEMLAGAADLVMRAQDHVDYFVAAFGGVIPELERQGGPSVVRRVSNLCRQFVPMIAQDGRANTVLLMLLMAAVKGAGFAGALRSGGQFAWIHSDESRGLLSRIDRMRATTGASDRVPPVGALTESELVTLFSGEEEMRTGDTPDAVLYNLEISYDAELQRGISATPVPSQRWIPVPENIRSVLGPDTVLVTYYSGITPQGQAGLYVTILTDQSVYGVIIGYGLPGMQVFLDEKQGDLLSLPIASVRESINENPGDGFVSTAAKEALQIHNYAAGPVGEILSRLHEQGKRHLCINPHGPLHFFPFHVLPYGNGLLADDWTVTYMPNLALLDPARRQVPVRDIPVTSFGIEFKNGRPHGLPVLPGAEAEATVVARAFKDKGSNVPALLAEAATETALRNAFLNARRIHLATHGLHAVSAPSFQRVYVSPDADNDGILYAYELLRLDLRGLDLLTLSACETALGRVDLGDNLRGLSANALVAGAATIIGTLWPVDNTAARAFFGSLYGELAKGTTKLEAFRIAQSFTRSLRPQYRDWAAFSYMGSW